VAGVITWTQSLYAPPAFLKMAIAWGSLSQAELREFDLRLSAPKWNRSTRSPHVPLRRRGARDDRACSLKSNRSALLLSSEVAAATHLPLRTVARQSARLLSAARRRASKSGENIGFNVQRCQDSAAKAAPPPLSQSEYAFQNDRVLSRMCRRPNGQLHPIFPDPRGADLHRPLLHGSERK
jgi:hypothetical protein